MLDALKPKTCPGIPSTVPPDLADYDDPDEGGERTTEGREERKRTIRFDDGDGGNKESSAPTKQDQEQKQAGSGAEASAGAQDLLIRLLLGASV